ncbi:hypothetical protein [Vibrio gangliei]|uniref:hypothetical protein n=1 Tax=Vibrio gangliei TaxID=2077090 RepID=UPI000D019B94|nr:hypothetical protein [Vibrio gangliei]
MKTNKYLLAVLIALSSVGVVNAADVSTMPIQSNNHTSISVSSDASNSNWSKSPKPTSTDTYQWKSVYSGSAKDTVAIGSNSKFVSVQLAGKSAKTYAVDPSSSSYTLDTFSYKSYTSNGNIGGCAQGSCGGLTETTTTVILKKEGNSVSSYTTSGSYSYKSPMITKVLVM